MEHADDSMILTSHKHVRTSENRIQILLYQMTKWADNAGFQWIKGERIEQVNQHRILGLIIDARITWNAHILYAKAKTEKEINIIKCLRHTKWGAKQQNLIKIHCMVILSTIRSGEEAYGSASQTVLRKLKPTHNRGLKLAFGLLVICRTENVLCEANLPTLAEMRELNNVKATIRQHTPSDPSAST
jgi:hypothetical protein